MRLLKFLLWDEVTKVSALATILMTALVVVLTCLAVHYAIKTFHKTPITVALTGISSSIRGDIVVGCEVSGWPYDDFTVQLKPAQCDSNEPSSWKEPEHLIHTTACNDGEYSLIAEVYHEGKTVARKEIGFNIDNTPPTFEIYGLEEGAVVGDSVKAEVILNSSDLTATIEARLDGKPVSVPVAVAGLHSGFHSLTFIAQDAVGNPPFIKTLGFVVDTNRPHIVSLGLENGERVGGRVRIEPEIEEEHLSQVSYLVDGTVQCSFSKRKPWV